MPIFWKDLEKSSPESKTNDLETWQNIFGQVCINNRGLALTYKTAKSNLITFMYEKRKQLQSRLMGNTSLENHMFQNLFYTGSSCPCQEAKLQSEVIPLKR